jgi:hypothetical protein
MTTVSGSLTAAGAGFAVSVSGRASFAVWGGNGKYHLERSYDSGVTWETVSLDTKGEPAAFNRPVSLDIDEGIDDVLYRVVVDSYSSGTFNYRLTAASADVIAPVNSVAPALSGTEVEGNTLTCSDGTWTGLSPITYTYQWFRDDVEIEGETANTYELVLADVGTVVHCEVTATNVGGTATEPSDDTATITGA